MTVRKINTIMVLATPAFAIALFTVGVADLANYFRVGVARNVAGLILFKKRKNKHLPVVRGGLMAPRRSCSGGAGSKSKSRSKNRGIGGLMAPVHEADPYESDGPIVVLSGHGGFLSSTNTSPVLRSFLRDDTITTKTTSTTNSESQQQQHQDGAGATTTTTAITTQMPSYIRVPQNVRLIFLAANTKCSHIGMLKEEFWTDLQVRREFVRDVIKMQKPRNDNTPDVGRSVNLRDALLEEFGFKWPKEGLSILWAGAKKQGNSDGPESQQEKEQREKTLAKAGEMRKVLDLYRKKRNKEDREWRLQRLSSGNININSEECDSRETQQKQQ